jgi:S1-C subfamily serine protease
VFAAVVIAAVTVMTTSTLPARFDVTPMAKADIDRRLERATVSLVALGCDLGLNGGTGVAIKGDRVVTNRHVAQHFRTLQLLYDGKPARALTPAQIGTGPANDVAVLRPGRLDVDPIALAGNDPRPGEPVWVSGYAHERRPDSLPDGLVVSPAHVAGYMPGRAVGERGPVMRVDVPVAPGMSGGPVLDQTGRLAGLIFATEGPSSGLVIPVSAIRRLLPHQPASPAHC